MSWLADNLNAIEERIVRACRDANRDRSGVTLIAVSKTFPLELIEEAYAFGVRDFGESKVQEAIPKIRAMPDDIRWHFIGTLQSNKVKKAAEHFDLIHTIDSTSQLREFAKLQMKTDILVEVNIAEESQKSGVILDELASFLEQVSNCPKVNFRGLMGMGAVSATESETATYFETLKAQAKGEILSMGMSGDFELAILHGATHIRVGTAIFGRR
jgi:PLP dependent protein